MRGLERQCLQVLSRSSTLVLLSILRSARRHHQGLLKDQEIDGDLNGRQAEQAEMKQEAAAAATRTAWGTFVMHERDAQTHRRRREGVEAENWPSVLQRQVSRGIQGGQAGCLMSHRDRSWGETDRFVDRRQTPSARNSASSEQIGPKKEHEPIHLAHTESQNARKNPNEGVRGERYEDQEHKKGGSCVMSGGRLEKT
ncbi:hypothetical protein C8J57DRAFT_1236692 [Mycena rebaudengoi]|nr:hypothetical protein C8J57DRAFT_1236692 [Mycena rebaudengoi]